MSAETKKILELIGKKSSMSIVSGFYRGLDDLRATVDFSDGRVPAYFTTNGYRPELNEPVWVLVADGVAYLLGPTVPKPSDGVVLSTAGGIAQVLTDIGTVEATYNQGSTFTDGVSVVKLFWSAGCHILGIKSANPPGPEIPPAPGGTSGGGGGLVTRTFTAIDSGSFQSGYGWRTNDVWCSVNNIGAWFYGTKFMDTIPDSATITRAQIYLPKTKELGSAPFGRHSSATKPAGPVTFFSTAELGDLDGWVNIPTALIDHLKANVGGLGFAGGGYSIWLGTQRDGQSGAVRVTYTT